MSVIHINIQGSVLVPWNVAKNKKAQLSLTNPRDASETIVRFMQNHKGDVVLVKNIVLVYIWTQAQGSLNGIESAFRFISPNFISPNSISPNFKSPMPFRQAFLAAIAILAQCIVIVAP